MADRRNGASRPTYNSSAPGTETTSNLLKELIQQLVTTTGLGFDKLGPLLGLLTKILENVVELERQVSDGTASTSGSGATAGGLPLTADHLRAISSLEANFQSVLNAVKKVEARLPPSSPPTLPTGPATLRKEGGRNVTDPADPPKTNGTHQPQSSAPRSSWPEESSSRSALPDKPAFSMPDEPAASPIPAAFSMPFLPQAVRDILEKQRLELAGAAPPAPVEPSPPSRRDAPRPPSSDATGYDPSQSRDRHPSSASRSSYDGRDRAMDDRRGAPTDGADRPAFRARSRSPPPRASMASSVNRNSTRRSPPPHVPAKGSEARKAYDDDSQKRDTRSLAQRVAPPAPSGGPAGGYSVHPDRRGQVPASGPLQEERKAPTLSAPYADVKYPNMAGLAAMGAMGRGRGDDPRRFRGRSRSPPRRYASIS